MAQVPNNLLSPCQYLRNEKLIVHLPVKFLTAGSELLYRVQLFNTYEEKNNISSKIVYYSLLDFEGKNVYSWYDELTRARSIRGILLPDTLSTGIYYLNAYTSFSRNLDPGYLHRESIYVISMKDEKNDELKLSEKKNEKMNNLLSHEKKNYPKANVKINKTLKTREKASFEITMENVSPTDSLAFSVSISQKPCIAVDTLLHSSLCDIKKNEVSFHKNKAFLVENEGKVISGNIVERKSGQPVKKAIVFLSVKDSVANLKYSITDTNGDFYYFIDRYYENQMLIFQMLDPSLTQDEVVLTLHNKKIPDETEKFTTIPMSGEMQKFQDKQKQIEVVNLVYQDIQIKNMDPAEPPDIQNRSGFHFKPDYTISMMNFVDLPGFKEIADNILPGVKYQYRDGKYYLVVYNPESETYMDEHAFVFLNGVPFNDFEYINNLGSLDIQSISVARSRIVFGDLTFNGIVSLRTNNMKLPRSFFSNHLVHRNMEHSFSFPGKVEISEQQIQDEHAPLFHSLLYFNSKIVVPGNQTIKKSFYTSDIKGNYELIIKGVLNNRISFSASKTFEIK